jgi:hypothetical protein
MYAAVIHLRNRAQALDELADHLSHRVADIGWQGFAAHAMRSRADDAVRNLRRCGQLHHEAAEALERHRRAALANPVGHIAHDAMSLASGAAAVLGDLL